MAFENVVLPTYSKTEEILNSVSHGIGVVLYVGICGDAFGDRLVLAQFG